MRALKISYQGVEVAQVTLNRPTLILGRSPVCDLVVRQNGIQPVHILFEYLGAEAFKPNAEEWSITDISSESQSDVEAKSKSAGQGTILDSQKCALGDFTFEWVENRLMQTDLQGGALTDQIRKIEKSATKAQSESSVLEIILVSQEREKVENIFHIQFDQPAQKLSSELPPLELDWIPTNREAPVWIRLPNLSSGMQFSQKGTPLEPRLEDGVKKIPLKSNDLLQMRWKLRDYYFRLVPKVEAAPTPIQLLKEPLFRTTLVGTILFLLLLFSLIEFVPEKVEEVPIPPRIARVDVSKKSATAIEAEDHKKPQAQTPLEKKVEEKSKKEGPKENEPQKTAQAPKKVIEGKNEKKDIGLNVPSPKKPVNQVGLLGALKPQATKNTVRADSIMQKSQQTRPVSGDQGLMVKQPPSGTLGQQTVQKQSSLTEASTKVGGGDKITAKNIGPLIEGSGGQGDFSIGVGGFSDTGSGSDTIETVEGGLDRETVRRILNQYRKEIRTCYERALLIKPRIGGRVSYRWTITGKGKTAALKLTKSTLDSPQLESCVQGVIQNIRWPEAAKGASTLVNCPFEFQKKS